MKVIKVNPEQLEQAWPHASKWIEKANLRGNSNYPLSDMGLSIAQGKKILLRCVDGNSFVWLVLGCVENSANRTAIVYAIGGKGLMSMIDDVVALCEAYAVSNGCEYITGSGRSGWVRALAKYGWNELGRTCGRRL